MIRIRLWLLVSALVLVSHPALALRCGLQLVLEGQTSYEVAQKCGQPQWQDQRVVFVSIPVGSNLQYRYGGRRDFRSQYNSQYFDSAPAYVQIPVNVDEWIYNFGPTQFMQKLTFENGRLTNIEDLGYGN